MNKKTDETGQNVSNPLQKREQSVAKLARQARFLELFPKHRFNISRTCQELGVSRTAFQRWLKEDEPFRQAINDLKHARDDLLEESLYDQALNKEHPIVQIFMAKSRLGWDDKNGPKPEETADPILSDNQRCDAIVEAYRISQLPNLQLQAELKAKRERRELEKANQELQRQKAELEYKLAEYEDFD